MITDINTRESKLAHTHAHSHLQALRNFCNRYPYPPYAITQVTDTVTGVIMEEEEWRVLQR